MSNDLTDTRLNQQIVVQVSEFTRARVTALRDAYAAIDGVRPAEAEIIRRMMHRAFPELEQEAGITSRESAPPAA